MTDRSLYNINCKISESENYKDINKYLDVYKYMVNVKIKNCMMILGIIIKN
jgi:hypothetical protein